MSPSSESVNLSAGLHPFRLHYRHTTGTRTLFLDWSGPGITRQAVPATAFFNIRYTPPAAFFGVDNFPCVVSDGVASVTAWVSVRVKSGPPAKLTSMGRSHDRPSTTSGPMACPPFLNSGSSPSSFVMVGSIALPHTR